MRKQLLICAVICIYTQVNAQYKKASFLSRPGMIYDFGVTQRLKTEGRGSATGFFISLGKETISKRIHHWYDLEYVPGSKFKYETTSTLYPGPVIVSGKSPSSYALRYNFAYFLVNNEKESTRILPFLTLGFGLTLTGLMNENYDANPSTYEIEKEPAGATLVFPAGAGAGFVFRFNEKFGLRVSGAYYKILQKDNEFVYPHIADHTAVSAALRIRLGDDE